MSQYKTVICIIQSHLPSNDLVIHGNLNAARYQQEVLILVAIPHLRAGGRGMMLLQDGAPPHTAHATQAVLQNQNICQLCIPPKSPDQNRTLLGQTE